MLKSKITIGAERSPNQDSYRMTLIEVESIESRQLSHSSLQDRLCDSLGVTVGKGYLKHNRAETNGFLRALAEVEYDGFRANSGGDIVCWLKFWRHSRQNDHLGRAKLVDSSGFVGDKIQVE